MRKGAMVLSSLPAIRGYGGNQAQMVQRAKERGDLNKLFEVLDILGNTPWCAGPLSSVDTNKSTFVTMAY